jgi:hypothetical protein
MRSPLNARILFIRAGIAGWKSYFQPYHPELAFVKGSIGDDDAAVRVRLRKAA